MSDPELEAVCAEILRLDPDGSRIARVLRNTLDQLYDGVHTGRYRWEELYKTEKTHCGTLVEINLHREFKFGNGETLDYRIAGAEVDCKYSQTEGEWMIPPEAVGHLCLVVWASDQTSSWKLGIVRASVENLGSGMNRDKKLRLKKAGRLAVRYLFPNGKLVPNVLLQLPRDVVEREIMSNRSGQKRINELFRRTLGLRVGRGVVATVARQDDYMRRVRDDKKALTGARAALRSEGIVVLGQYDWHREIARALGQLEPSKGDFVPLRLVPANKEEPFTIDFNGRFWKVANEGDPIAQAPDISHVKPTGAT